MNRLDQFLGAAARQMRIMPAALRDEELRELRGHIEQRVEDYANQGMSDDAAQARALEGLGSARKLGASLCDAWEGIAFSWWRLAATIAGVTLLLLFGIVSTILAMVTIPMNSETALLPEIVPSICAFYMALPMFCGMLFSHWLGRRGCLVATLYFLVLAFCHLTLTFPSDLQPPARFTAIYDAVWLPYFWIILAFTSAWGQQFWRVRKRHQLALVGLQPLSPSHFLWVPLNFDWWRNMVLVFIVGGALYAARVWMRFHPQTPEATLHNHLVLNRQMNMGDFEPPKILTTRELPAQSPAEIAGTQKRFEFKIEERMTPGYKERRVSYLKQLLNGPKQQRPFEDATLRLSLARMQRNRQVVQGKATLSKTPSGWKVVKKNFDNSWRLGAWAYDLAYQR